MAKHSKKMRGGNCGAMHEGGRRRRTVRGGGFAFSANQAGSGLGVGNALRSGDSATAPAPGGPHGAGEFVDSSRGGNATGGRRRRGSRKTRRVVKKKSVATIKRLLKAKGLKVSGSRRALTARARKARIPMKGGGMVTGTPYGGYVGTGSAGLPSQFAGAHPVSNNVMSLPGVNDGGYYQNGAGGLTPA
jgi:hypothetical protein